MTTQQAVKHFGSKVAIARKLKISAAAVSQWGTQPPPLRQIQLERISKGALKARKI